MVSVIDHRALCLVGRGSGGSPSHCFYRVILIIFYRFSLKKKKKMVGVINLILKSFGFVKNFFFFFFQTTVLNFQNLVLFDMCN
jgi:hypothetical protein